MSEFSFAVLISGNGSNLQAMIDSVREKKISGQICCVVSNNPEAFGIERAKRAKIPVEVINHREFSSREEFDSEMIKGLEKYKPNLVVLSGFMRILSPVFINHYHGKLLNIHPSLLPKYPGLDTHQRVLDSGDKYHGVTIHFVDSTLDGGPICAQSQLTVNTRSAEELQNEIHSLEHVLYPKVIDWFSKKRLKLVKGIVYLDNRPIKLAK